MSILNEAFWESGALMSSGRGSLLLGYGPPTRKAIRQQLDDSQPAWYCPDFFLHTPLPWIQYPNWQEMTLHQLNDQLEVSSDVTSVEWTLGHRDLFLSTFHTLQQAFREGVLEKAVPYTFAYSSAHMSKKRLQASLKQAVKYVGEHPGWLYGYWNCEEGVLGITPETLFLHHASSGSVVHTMALAGTKSQRQQNTLQQDDKEIYEHQVVVRGICQSLQKLGSVKVGERCSLHLPTLSHLLTPIELNLKQAFDFERLVHALHPTPALGAFPLEEGWKWLKNYQRQLERKCYGAPVGIVNPRCGLAACFVSIRHVQWNERGMRIGAGCGVVKDSCCEREWNEIHLKVQAIRKSLAL